jgi:replicative DNA helicase
MPSEIKAPANPVETERAVLCVLLNDSYAIMHVMGVLETPDNFSTVEHQAVYGAILTLTKELTVPNVHTVAARLGWTVDRLQAIAEGFTTKDSQEVVYLAEVVAKAARWRRQLAALEEVERRAAEPQENVEDFAEWAASKLMQVGESRNDRDPSIQAVAERAEAEIAQLADTGLTGTDVGWPWLNAKTGGLGAGHVWILAAPYKGRKTSFARNLVIDVCRNGGAMDWFAAEGDQGSTWAGLLAMMATELLYQWGEHDLMALSETFIRRGMRMERIQDSISQAKAELEGFNLRIYDGRDRIHTAEQIAAKVKRDQFLFGTGAFVVDYMQLLGTGKLFDRMETSTHTLQTLIQTQGLTGILLTQLSESTIWLEDDDDADEHYSPGVKGGGDIPAAADFLFTTRYRSATPDLLTVKLKLARHSRPGWCKYHINAPSGRILEELESDEGD